MIYVVEGPNAAGKSTFCGFLAGVLRIPSYVDRGRQLAQAAGATGAELQALTPNFDLLVEQVGPNHDFVLDRYWPTTFVFKELNPDRPGLPPHLAAGPVQRALEGRGVEVLVHVRAPVGLLLERLRARGDDPDPDRVEAEVVSYDRLFARVAAAGVRVVVVDGSRGAPLEKSLR